MFGYLTTLLKKHQINSRNNGLKGKEGWQKQHNTNDGWMSWPTYGLLILLEIILAVVAILAVVDTAQTKGWETWLMVLLLILLFIPVVGNIFAIVIIIYWLVEIRGQSHLLENLSSDK